MKTKKFEDFHKINESAPNAEIQNAYTKTEDFKKYKKQISEILTEAQESFEKFLEEEYDTDLGGNDEALTWNFVVQDLTGLGEYY
jgi:hypothetical protein